MPYITTEKRIVLDEGSLPVDAGELNYVITTIINDYLRVTGRRYGDLNEVIGVLECAKQELYRRVVAPYEDVKREENGDVYG